MFSAIGGTVAGIQGNLAAAERVLEIIDIPSEPDRYGSICADFFEGEEDESRAARFDSKEPEHVESEYAVVVENLSFKYPRSDEYVLKDVSFSVPKGKTLAIVGPSGSGKTTIFKLLLGLYPPTSGDIIVEGRSIFETDVEEWRQKFSYVPQDAFLFSGSILDNVKSPDADNTRELDELEQEVREALSMARADLFVDELPDGILAPVGERGARLSGGQRQRIAIPRDIAKDAPKLLLDEATASLDNESERFIQESLEELMGERTCLVIAHRLSTIEKADKIIYLEDGSVVEEGTHEELMGNPDSKYRMLVERNLFWREERSKRDGAFCFTGTSSVPMLLNTPIGAL
jgi:ABC-type multidrug transport system fused ATPase/permease subunit